MRNGTKLMRKETVTCRFNEMLVLGFRHRFSHLLTMYALLTRLELVDGFERLWRQNGQKSLRRLLKIRTMLPPMVHKSRKRPFKLSISAYTSFDARLPERMCGEPVPKKLRKVTWGKFTFLCFDFANLKI